MKKFIFTLLVSALFFLPSLAQTAQIATLSHEGQVSTFYSANALKDAYNAAVDGDIITLSSGSFIGVNIEKSITVRGAGMMPDDNPTIITGINNIGASSSAANKPTLTLEGLFFNEKTLLLNSVDSRFIKCRFNEVEFYSKVSNFTILNCFMNPVKVVHPNSTGNIINSFMNFTCNVQASIVLTNCHVYYCHAQSMIAYQINQTLKNCLIIGDKGTGNSKQSFLASNVISHCYYVGTNTDAFNNQSASSNVLTGKTESEIYGESSVWPWTLKEEFAKEWLGDDGTQVGMYGGIMPFDPTPTNPQITKFNVSSKTTADGKLSVDIEVKAN